MSNENNERNIPEDTAENIRSGGTALSLGSTALKMLDKCGAICKKIPNIESDDLNPDNNIYVKNFIQYKE